MDLKGKRLLVIGGAGFIGSHLADQLLDEGVAEVRVFDNFCRGAMENLEHALRDPRTRVFEGGGDVLHPDVLDRAMQGVDGVFHLAALWLLHCHEYPRAAFEVNVAGTFNVLEGHAAQQRAPTGLLLLGLGIRRRRDRAHDRGPSVPEHQTSTEPPRRPANRCAAPCTTAGRARTSSSTTWACAT